MPRENTKANTSSKSQTKAKKKEKPQKIKRKAPKTVQQSIPYETVFENGIIMVEPGKYSKSYHLDDVNFSIADQSVQESMFLDYEGLLNSVDATMTAEVTMYNRSINPEVVKNKILLKPKGDKYNSYRDEYNEMLADKMSEGRNNLKKEKYLTITIQAPNIQDGTMLFKRIDSEVKSKVARINKQDVEPMTIEERLALLYDIFNNDIEVPFDKKIAGVSKNGKMNLATVNAAGLTSKDLIAPNGISFSHNMFQVGDMYARSFYLDNLPSFMNTNILTDISDLPCNMLTSVIYQPIPNDKAAKMVKDQITNVRENIVRQQKKAMRGGYSMDMMSPELKRAEDEALALRNDMQSRNQKLFKVTVVMTLFADSLEELDQLSASLKSVGVTYLCNIKPLMYQQESGFRSSLPLANMDLSVDRVLNTEASAVFMPFSVQELSQENGIYYGLNAVSKNLILYDRLSADNYNGLIFGKPGSGKSFIAKSEILAVLLGTDDDVFVIDPEGEYKPLADHFGGQVIRLAIGSDTHINPLDMDVQYDEDPVAAKCDFIMAICETIVGHGNLDPIMINMIHKCGRKIYQPYYEHMEQMIKKRDKNGHRITCDREQMPTLLDFYHALRSQEEPRAQALAAALEMYCIGTYDLFAKQTNVNTEARFVVYDIKDITTGMKELALQICLNDIWNRIIENKKKGKRTWFYIDEFYLLTQTKTSARFVEMVYKRARKWGGIPTGITQNVEDLLTNEDARTILSNCNFLLMMNQSQIDRAALADLYSISENLQDYINDKPAGTGLLYTGSSVIPFTNSFPKESSVYKIFSTKVTER